MSKNAIKSRNKALVLIIAVLLIGSYLIIFQPWTGFVTGAPSVPPSETDPVTGEKYSFSMFQALRVVYTDGTDSWKYPQTRTTLSPLTIWDSSKKVSSLQAYIFFNFLSDKQFSSVAFKCNAKLSLYDKNKNLVKTLGEMPVLQTISSTQNATDVYVISATITTEDFQKLVVPSGVNIDETYYYVISCSDINAEVRFADGTSKTFSATGVQATENWLWWKFRIIQSGTVMQVTGLSIEWVWR